MDFITRRGYPILFGFLVLFSVVEMFFAALATSKYDVPNIYPDNRTQFCVRFILATSIWTIVLFAAYLVTLFVTMDYMTVSLKSRSRLLFITWLLWLSAAIAITIVPDLDNVDMGEYRKKMKTILTFAWFIWALITSTILLDLILRLLFPKRDNTPGGEGDTTIQKGYAVIFIALYIFSIPELFLSALVKARYNFSQSANSNYPARIVQDCLYFVLATSAWTNVFCAVFLILFLVTTDGSKVNMVWRSVFISTTWLFWLATAATITIGLTDRLNCNPQDPKNILYCDQLKTIVSLAWFIWALITVTFIIALIHRLRPGDRVDTRHAGNATSGRDEAP